MDKEVKLMFMLGLIVLSLFLVSAQERGRTIGAFDEGNPEVTNQTYGQCVSAAAKIKNGCYDQVNTNYQNCLDDVSNLTDDKKNALMTCLTTYKQSKTACKTDFKAVKNGQCKRIKHNFFETARYAFV